MPRIHVCPLARIDETVAATGARSLVTLLNPGTPVERPAAIPAERHLYIGVADIVEAQLGKCCRPKRMCANCSISPALGIGPSRC